LNHDGVLFGFNRYRYAKNNPYRYVDPDGRQDATALAVWIAGYIETGSIEGANEYLERSHAARIILIEGAIETSRVGLVITGVEVAIDVASGNDATDKAIGVLIGETVGSAAENLLDKFIGNDAAGFMGALIGSEVEDAVEETIKLSETKMLEDESKQYKPKSG
jgi:hypothetical protein